MNSELTQRLVKRFPVLYQDYHSPMTQTCMCWGFDHGDGWFEIIWQLSLAIEEELGYSWLQKRWFLVKKGFCRWWNRVVYKLSPVQDDKRKQEGSGTKEDPYQPNPERRYAQREEEDMLKKSIQSLRPALRVVVQLQQLQERSTRETAEAIGITMAATKGRLFHARKALRKSLTPKLLHQPRFTSRIRILPAGQWLGQNECTNTLRPSTSIQSQGRGM